jgi:hypothetical protein
MARNPIEKVNVTPPGGALPSPNQHDLDIVEVETKRKKLDHSLRASTTKDIVAYCALFILLMGCFVIWAMNISSEHNVAASHILTLIAGGIMGAYFASRPNSKD